MKKELLPRRDSAAEKAPDMNVRGFQFFLCEAAYETTANCVPISMFSSLIQTILSVPESPHMRVTGSAAHRHIVRVADYTAGWDLHPTPKTLFLLPVYYNSFETRFQEFC